MTREIGCVFYRQMWLIRRFEQKAIQLFQEGHIRGSIHLSIGQEAVAVGVCSALRENDLVATTHRGHGHCLMKGVDPERMFAELLGRETGVCKGRGGSMHVADLSKGILGANGIVGAGLPIAVGGALAALYRGTGQVVVCFFGDGASNTGAFHESLNLSAVWRLPVVWVCENNMYGMTTPARDVTAVEDVALRAASYNMPGLVVDGNDVEAVFHAALEFVDRARQGKGPALLECKTYRWEGHFYGDPMVYRSKQEVEEWKEKDPVARLRAKLAAEMAFSDEEIAWIETQAAEVIEEAAAAALLAPYPSPEEVEKYVYGDLALGVGGDA